MKHKLKVHVSKERADKGIVACKQVKVRDKLLRFLLGNPIRLTVLVPGNSVEEVIIEERRAQEWDE